MNKISFMRWSSILVLIMILAMSSFRCKKDDPPAAPQKRLSMDSTNSEPASEVYVCSCKPAEVNPSGDFTIAFQGRYKGSGIYSNCDERYLIQFNLDSIPGNAKITQALLQLYCLEMEGTPVNKMIYESIIEQWQSNLTTFKAKPATDTLNRILTNWPATKQWHNIDLTSFVKSWIEIKNPNYGIMCYSMEESASASAKFSSSKNSRKDIRPVLKIWYEY